MLALYLEEGPFRIFSEASLEEELEWSVRAVLGLDAKEAWSPKSR